MWVVFIGLVPVDVADLGIRFADRDLDVSVVPTSDGAQRFLIAIAPAIEIGEITGATLLGTNPDGNRYTYPRPPDAAAGMSFAEAIGAN